MNTLHQDLIGSLKIDTVVAILQIGTEAQREVTLPQSQLAHGRACVCARCPGESRVCAFQV